jgi:hypothetical protein
MASSVFNNRDQGLVTVRHLSTARGAARIHARAKLARNLVVGVTLALCGTRILDDMLLPRAASLPIGEAGMVGVCLLALFSVALEWSTRMYRQDCWREYKLYRRSSRIIHEKDELDPGHHAPADGRRWNNHSSSC